MALVRLRGPLRKLAADRPSHEIGGATVVELLEALVREHPAMDGWVLDERGQIRRHINVYVDGERGDEGTPVGEGARVDVLPAISGGSA